MRYEIEDCDFGHGCLVYLGDAKTMFGEESREIPMSIDRIFRDENLRNGRRN